MRIRTTSAGVGVTLLVGCALAAPCAAPAFGADAVLYFKNGRALRVVDYRTEGDWLFFMVSPPPPPSATPPGEEDTGPSEMGIQRSLVVRIETPQTARSGGVANTVAGGGGASGGSEEGPRSASGGVASTADLGHVPAMGSSAAAQRGSRPTMPQVDVSKSGAGYALKGDVRNGKVPHRILKQAQDYQAQVRAAKAQQRLQPGVHPPTAAAAGSEGATAPPPAQAPDPASPLPDPEPDPEGPSS